MWLEGHEELTRRAPRTSPTIERSERDSARHHPYNAGYSGEARRGRHRRERGFVDRRCGAAPPRLRADSVAELRVRRFGSQDHVILIAFSRWTFASAYSGDVIIERNAAREG